MHQTTVFIACCGSKLDHAAPAGDIYTSDLFKKAKAWAQRFGARWFILSAKHGLLDPSTVIEPYDETLNTKTAAELAAWNALVIEHVGAMRGRLVVLAGAKYRGWCAGVDHETPMAGMGIGQQKAWLKAQVSTVHTPSDDELELAHDALIAQAVERCFRVVGGGMPFWRAIPYVAQELCVMEEELKAAYDAEMAEASESD
jgi:hypothetical protein